MDLRNERWHFIGIGGAGMSALASALLDLGAEVSGSDLVESEATRLLEDRGARIAVGHDARNLDNATRVVLTAAVRDDNPELLEARRLGVPVVKRAALLGMDACPTYGRRLVDEGTLAASVVNPANTGLAIDLLHGFWAGGRPLPLRSFTSPSPYPPS